jgi:Myb-like DNA-binding domain
MFLAASLFVEGQNTAVCRNTSNCTMLTPVINKKITKIIAVAHMKTSAKYEAPGYMLRFGGTKKVVTGKENQPARINRGRWTTQERLTFLRGLRVHGKSKWKEISKMIPTRYVQVPSFVRDASLCASRRFACYPLRWTILWFVSSSSAVGDRRKHASHVRFVDSCLAFVNRKSSFNPQRHNSGQNSVSKVHKLITLLICRQICSLLWTVHSH